MWKGVKLCLLDPDVELKHNMDSVCNGIRSMGRDPGTWDVKHIDKALEFLAAVIGTVDASMKAKKTEWKNSLQNYRELTMMCDVLVKVCGNVYLDDFLWKDI